MSEAPRHTRGKGAGRPGDPPPPAVEPRLDAGEVGVLTFLLSEFFFFGALLFTYIYYIGVTPSGPQPQQVLHPLSATISLICIGVSGFTLSAAAGGARRRRRGIFVWSLLATILLGLYFVLGTAEDWYALVVYEHVLPRTNLFSSNYFTVTGFHLFHVGAGVIALMIVLGMVGSGWGTVQYAKGVKLVAWYWYFVIAVAVWVYVVVYYGHRA